jgi:succinate-semialdehyde dehydrogenase/glutarate-semialdehyde dehydrogenase
VLELVGSDPFILLGTNDMDATVEAAVAARLDKRRPVVSRRQGFGLAGLSLDRTFQVLVLSIVASLTRLVSGRRLGALRSLAVSSRRRPRIGLATDRRPRRGGHERGGR